MALVKAGVWHTTVWCSRLWQEDLWLEYGAYVPPAPPAHGEIASQHLMPIRFIHLLRDYVETLGAESDG